MIMEPASAAEEDESSVRYGSHCTPCGTELQIPWIRCTECQPHQDICTHCFSSGVEFGQHESDHPYMVMRYSFPIFEASWTAAEEISLLEAVQEHGLGNWPAISARLRVKTPEDCERHYFKYYVENPQPPLPAFDDLDILDKGAPVVFKLSDNPPRPPEGSTLWIEMGGYSAARCDFNVEHDNFIEMDVCHMTFSDEDDSDDDEVVYEESGDEGLYKELKFATLDVYRNCLKERQRRKKIVRDYGLINVRKWYAMLKRRFDQSVSLDFLRPFMRLFAPITYDKYLESLLYEKQLKMDILRLQEYRRSGITRLRSVKAYYQMKQRRERAKSERHLLSDVLSHAKDEQTYLSWLTKQARVEGSTKASLPTISRKVVPRLLIDGLPGYEKLSDAEKEMCSEVRLVPMAYLEFARILTSECAKQGCLKLAQARTLIKIDVNKTRKLYDFLIKEGHITKDPV